MPRYAVYGNAISIGVYTLTLHGTRRACGNSYVKQSDGEFSGTLYIALTCIVFVEVGGGGGDVVGMLACLSVCLRFRGNEVKISVIYSITLDGSI